MAVLGGVGPKCGDVVQLVRTLPCHGRGREFESRRPRHTFPVGSFAGLRISAGGSRSCFAALSTGSRRQSASSSSLVVPAILFPSDPSLGSGFRLAAPAPASLRSALAHAAKAPQVRVSVPAILFPSDPSLGSGFRLAAPAPASLRS